MSCEAIRLYFGKEALRCLQQVTKRSKGGIPTENGSVQTLWAPKKISPKMKKRKKILVV